MINLVMRCRELPGKRLFQYKDENGKRKAITTTQVNQYIKDATGDNFSAKDFRTWAGSVYALSYLLQQYNTEMGGERNLQDMLKYVSERLGNTPTVCRKYYIHPQLITIYEKGGSMTHPSLTTHTQLFGKKGLSKIEKLLLRILKTK
ncbi:MAG: hypothetical protein NVV59_12465 [Chitinophagaceae bacterium]|nr:hypothetical protein [Chitinophagaceae bacterium]